MKVLAKMNLVPDQYALVSLDDNGVIRKVNDLVRKGEYTRAIEEALQGGEFLRGVALDNVGDVAARLILTRKSAHWDLSA